MQLTERQLRAITDWAHLTPLVKEVRLFGSRAKGCAKPESDVDLAVTIGGGDPGTILGNYIAFADQWERDLSEALGLDVKLNHLNTALPESKVRQYCQDFSLVLFPTGAMQEGVTNGA